MKRWKFFPPILFRRSRRSIADFMARNSGDVFFRYRLHPTRRVEYTNDAVEKVLGFPKSMWYSDSTMPRKVVHPEDLHILETLIAGTVPDEPTVVRWVARDGRVVWVEETFHGEWSRQGYLLCIDAIGRDVSDRVISEQRYRSMVEENTRLLTDVHRRVGRSLQMLSSVIKLHEVSPQKRPSRHLYMHVRALALISDGFERADSLISVSMGRYLRAVVHTITEPLGESKPINVSLDIEPLELHVDQATACGLLLVELMAELISLHLTSNESPQLGVGLSRPDEEHIELVVYSSTLTPEPVFVQSASSTYDFSSRVELVTALVTQLQGTLTTIETPRGSKVRFAALPPVGRKLGNSGGEQPSFKV